MASDRDALREELLAEHLTEVRNWLITIRDADTLSAGQVAEIDDAIDASGAALAAARPPQGDAERMARTLAEMDYLAAYADLSMLTMHAAREKIAKWATEIRAALRAGEAGDGPAAKKED